MAGMEKNKMRRIHFAFWMAAALTLPDASVAQTTQAAIDPAAIERDKLLASDLVAAVNADARARALWAAKYHSQRQGAYSEADLVKMLEDIAQISHGVTTTGNDRKNGWLRIDLRAANGKTGKLLLDTDGSPLNGVTRFNAYARPSTYPTPLIAQPVSRDILRKAIDERLRFAAARDEFSGSVLVMRNDELIYSGAFGQANKNFNVPNTMDTRFHTGSMDKMFTAVLIGQLIEQGRLTLDTRVIDVLPDYPNADAARAITIRHLLSHQSGVASSFGDPEIDRFRPFERVSELLPRFAAKPLDFTPGTQAGYSNEGFILLGAIVEKLTGQSYYDAVQSRVFDRAGMKNTIYYRVDEISPLRAEGYRFPDSDFLGFGTRIGNSTFQGRGYRGNSCGGSYTTAGDMTRFLQALRMGKLLSPAMAEEMTGLQKGYNQYGYGFLHRKIDDKTVRGHNGGGAFSGINSMARIVWESGYTVVALGNYDAPLIEWVGDDIVHMVAAQP
ncbi:CubicO group peptidase (beta-lactamase class C family) [Sphingomonas kyeonggiensis]|uniref:CubicO group peptidase (Beta-lactamase class C family) n=1 Tax=Sphingomonas kyeonggiensis TaxID=1268553 RepID=A0A7W7K1L4_9SPHN|nr:serine hydrolase domain-containing protein [Sphingomonas kyeonggiensis]MBB4839038.1 CubicO group peptidase (beta-lactamase class C family) [Sphingomonas kyeonggiensis]